MSMLSSPPQPHVDIAFVAAAASCPCLPYFHSIPFHGAWSSRVRASRPGRSTRRSPLPLPAHEHGGGEDYFGCRRSPSPSPAPALVDVAADPLPVRGHSSPGGPAARLWRWSRTRSGSSRSPLLSSPTGKGAGLEAWIWTEGREGRSLGSFRARCARPELAGTGRRVW